MSAHVYLLEPGQSVSIGDLLNARRLYPGDYESSWYGRFSCDFQTKWILHEDHGRQHYFANDNNRNPMLHWLFDEGLNDWIMVLPLDYPKIYMGEARRPFVWKDGTRYPNRVFTDPSTGLEWTEAELRIGGGGF